MTANYAARISRRIAPMNGSENIEAMLVQWRELCERIRQLRPEWALAVFAAVNQQCRQEITAARAFWASSRFDRLSPGERQVLELYVQPENSVKAIAAIRNSSCKTVQTQLSQIYRKLGVENRAGLVRLYCEEKAA